MSASEQANETETPQSPPPLSKEPKSSSSSKSKEKRSKKKKKRISKHVLKSKQDAQEKQNFGGKETMSSTEQAAAPDPSSTKDPDEASNYLKAWQAKEGWKFNKNTQSWLLRHMYETDKVSKNTFTILLEYMKGLQGKDAKKRVLEEATARAQRYRDYEKNKESSSGDANHSSNTNKAADGEKTTDEALKRTTTIEDNDGYGLEHWNRVDDHDKRKEYKRARRVLETLTETD